MKSYTKILLTFFEVTFIITGVVLFIYLALGQMLEITGESMAPLLRDKQRILAEKISPKFTTYKRGDIIVFKSPEDKNRLIIKRIIGLSEEKIKISNGKVYINGSPITENYLDKDTKTIGTEQFREEIEFTIPYQTYFVLGDNRAESIDSRYWGTVDYSAVLGKPLFIYLPISEFRLL